MGERLANNSTIFYENVVRAGRGPAGRGELSLADVARLLRGSNAYAAICTLGVARTAFNRALKRARSRAGRQADHRARRHRRQFGDLYTRLESARTYVFRAAWAADHADPFDPKMAAMPKLLASQMAFEVTRARWRCSAAPA